MKIKHINGSVLFEDESTDIASCLKNIFKERISLSGAYLYRANLSGVYLSGVYLSGANLSGANLSRAYLFKANLSGANLSEANLSGADLSEANLSKADLFKVNLSGADLSGANLYGANLSGANLSGAILSGANLSRAYLFKASLYGANLSEASLYGANLSEANLSRAYLPNFSIVPSEGGFYAWKRTTRGIIKIYIPAKAKRTSSLVGRKCRAEYVKVVSGPGCGGMSPTSSNRIVYNKGNTIYADKWDDDIRTEYTHGIHFFMTKKEAEEY